MSGISLSAVRGATGTTHEGSLVAQSDDATCCFGGSKKKTCFFVVKGPWMLKFKGDDKVSGAIGQPIPLDGATVTALGETDFELCNANVKDNFYGKQNLQDIDKTAKKSFARTVGFQFTAPSRESRDAWVLKLQDQIKTIGDLQAQRMQNHKTSRPRDFTVRTAAFRNTTYAALFAEYEDDSELDLFRKEVAIFHAADSEGISVTL